MAADVPARSAELLVAEDGHELGPQTRDVDGVEGPAGGPVGVPEARHVGHDHVERVRGIATVRAGVGEERDDLGVAPERVRPSVAEDQRQDRPDGVHGAGVHEMDPEAAHRDPEARQPGEGRLLRRPVEALRPVVHELPEVVQVRPEGPPGVLGRVRPARRAQARAQVFEHRGGGLLDERLRAGQRIRHGRILGSRPAADHPFPRLSAGRAGPGGCDTPRSTVALPRCRHYTR